RPGNARVQIFPRVLLEMGRPDADAPARSVLPDLQPAVLADRQLVLGDLIALREIRIEVILAGKPAQRRDRAVQGEARADGELDGLAVDDREDARQAAA